MQNVGRAPGNRTEPASGHDVSGRHRGLGAAHALRRLGFPSGSGRCGPFSLINHRASVLCASFRAGFVDFAVTVVAPSHLLGSRAFTDVLPLTSVFVERCFTALASARSTVTKLRPQLKLLKTKPLNPADVNLPPFSASGACNGVGGTPCSSHGPGASGELLGAMRFSKRVSVPEVPS